jgi:hypothetical protein
MEVEAALWSGRRKQGEEHGRGGVDARGSSGVGWLSGRNRGRKRKGRKRGEGGGGDGDGILRETREWAERAGKKEWEKE